MFLLIPRAECNAHFHAKIRAKCEQLERLNEKDICLLLLLLDYIDYVGKGGGV
jgi:hypothetical protein